MTITQDKKTGLPANPLDQVKADDEIHRRTVVGILESYNSNYDVLAEMIQNSVDALEDAFLLDLPGPYLLKVHINLQNNWISVFDTGVGMTPPQAVAAFAPHASFKNDNDLLQRRGKHLYRGYKGVGLTFLAYGTDSITLHTKTSQGELTKGRMQYARAWAFRDREELALVVEDNTPSFVDENPRGTFIKVELSPHTRPKKLSQISPRPEVWEVILRTRTAIGQISLLQTPLLDSMDVSLTVTDTDGTDHDLSLKPSFLLPHLVPRKPDFRFLDIPAYYAKHSEQTDIPVNFRRQDGIYLIWDKDKIYQELTGEQKEQFKDEINLYNPLLYAFFPYQASVWSEINEALTHVTTRRYLTPGLIIGVNRQRLADVFEIEPTRYTNLAPILFVLIHFDNAKPDQGRKTLQDEIVDLAKRAADRVLQYIAKQRGFLKPPGEAPTPGQREVEKNHEDWVFNVRLHARQNPLSIPPVTYQSEPLEEQDVVGLFHQLSARGVFPGIEVFATSQSKTYDCLVRYSCSIDIPGLRYIASDENPLGVSPFILGDKSQFETRPLTLEFKNNIDALTSELAGKPGTDSRKDFAHIDICVCWGMVSDSFPGYTLEEVTKQNIDERMYPGVTHILRRDGDSNIVQVIMLQKVVEMINTGRLTPG